MAKKRLLTEAELNQLLGRRAERNRKPSYEIAGLFISPIRN